MPLVAIAHPLSAMSDRSRSASPVRESKKQKTSGGFKWKDKKATVEGDGGKPRDSGALERGYRDRSPNRESRKAVVVEEPATSSSAQKSRAPERSQESPSIVAEPIKHGRDDLSAKFGERRARDVVTTRSAQPADPTDTDAPPVRPPAEGSTGKPPRDPSKPKKDKKPKFVTPTEPMILVNVNDRLGTKASIPCLASDSVKAFKAVVAAHIGRQPHEIMLKRQGERPFKDVLTLRDYGVSSGVQLDLELETGD